VHPGIAKIPSHNPQLLNHVVAARQIRVAHLGAQSGQAYAPGSANAANLDIEDLLDIERGLYVNPENELARHFRLYLCPGVIAAGVMTFTPQRRCVPIRLCIPSGVAGNVSQLQSGVEQYYASAGAVPAAVYSELAEQTGWLRPIITEVGNTITATTTVANGQAVGLWCFDLSEKGLLAPPMGKPRAMGFSVSVPNAGTAQAVLNPQKDFRIRRLALDETVTNYGSLTVTGFTVANDPQTEANGVLPVQMFSTKALAAMIDGDLCKVGASIVVTFANSNAAPVTAQGEAWGDTED
jgi:ethanolamine utilization microcompartment shell protein EutS